MRDSESLLTGAHCLAWIASPRTLLTEITKKFPVLQPSRGQCLFIHWLLAWDGYVSAFICSYAAISVFFHSTECGNASVLSLAGASFVSFLPLSGFISVIVSCNCTASSNSLAFTIIKSVLPPHSLLPSLKAAPSVALPLNPACLKGSTWLHVHTPTLITV